MSTSNTETPQVGWFTRLVRVTLRLIFAVVLGLALGAGIYYGTIAIFNNVIEPIQDNTQGIKALETRFQLAEEDQKQQADEITARIQALEISGDQHKAALAELQGRIDTLEADQAALLETATNELNAILDQAAQEQDALKKDVGNLDADLKSLNSEMNGIVQNYDSLQAEVDELVKNISANDENLARIEAEWNEKLSEFTAVQHDLQLFKTIELLTRSRYHLVQNNLGLARQDIQDGYDLLLLIQGTIPEYQVETYSDILSRIESALANLPQRPVAAADDVDSAWNLLLRGLPDQPEADASSTSTPTPASSVTPTPTPTPQP